MDGCQVGKKKKRKKEKRIRKMLGFENVNGLGSVVAELCQPFPLKLIRHDIYNNNFNQYRYMIIIIIITTTRIMNVIKYSSNFYGFFSSHFFFRVIIIYFFS